MDSVKKVLIVRLSCYPKLTDVFLCIIHSFSVQKTSEIPPEKFHAGVVVKELASAQLSWGDKGPNQLEE